MLGISDIAKKIAYVGIDYHINLLSIAVVIEGEKDLYQTIHQN